MISESSDGGETFSAFVCERKNICLGESFISYHFPVIKIK